MDKIERAVDDIRRKWAPDGRLAVFEVSIASKVGAQDSGNVGGQHAAPLLVGVTTSRDARDALRRLAGETRLSEQIQLIPDGAVAPAAVVTAALAPLLGEPRLAVPRVSEVLHGEVLDVLEGRDDWLRVRAPDGYIAWLNAGYVATGPTDWAEDWTERATARSLSADILTTDGRRRLPTGARVALRRGVVELADGQRGAVAAGSVRREQELRVEARHLALPELAQKWYAGAPYLWGGRTEWGIDCSGLAQAVFAARAIKLPRDSDQQFGQGKEIAMSRDGVGGDHLFGDAPRMVRLRASLVGVRRLS